MNEIEIALKCVKSAFIGDFNLGDELIMAGDRLQQIIIEVLQDKLKRE
jgi:hypothetical protein